MKKKTVLVRGARQLLTLHGPSGARRGSAMRDLGIVTDGALLIENGHIVEVGTSRRIENLAAARNAEEIDATGKVVLPGFVDSHTHLVFAAPRLVDYEMRIAGCDDRQIAEAGGGLPASVKSLHEASGPRLRADALRMLHAFHAHGTTTVEAKSGYGLDETNELKTLRVMEGLRHEGYDVLPTYLGAHAIPSEFAGRANEYIEWITTTMLPVISRRGLAQFADIRCDRGAFTLEQARAYLSAARGLNFHLKIHGEQFEHTGAAALAVELCAASADHLNAATEDDARLLAGSPTVATLLPGSVFHLGLTHYAPARLLIDQGAAVALATDFNPGTSPTLSMPMILSLACAQMRMTSAEAISAATINGAHALRAGQRIGSLEFGKEANLVLYDAADYREIPYHFGVNLVRLTMFRGEVVYRAPQSGGA
ncbi:MAG: imidazolonepropionase [Acidobacteria bacterium]|nr:imidazolonepropionase [Acidobacteriota bacterium]